jgi:hypothetical protein
MLNVSFWRWSIGLKHVKDIKYWNTSEYWKEPQIILILLLVWRTRMIQVVFLISVCILLYDAFSNADCIFSKEYKIMNSELEMIPKGGTTAYR